MDDVEVPQEYLCPITQTIMEDPVVDARGDTYERFAIAEWYSSKSNSPLSGVVLTESERQILIPNRVLKNQIQDWLERNPQATHDNAASDVLPQRDQQTRAPAIPPQPSAPPASFARRHVIFHEAQREEMHELGLRWYHALPPSVRKQWDAWQLDATVTVDDMLLMMGDEYGDHKHLLIKALGDLDGDGVLTPDEMRAILYISANFLVCGICQGPIVMLQGSTCLECTRQPFVHRGGGRAWVCNECMEDGGRQDPLWGGTCSMTGRRHLLDDLLDIRESIQVKLSSGEVSEQAVLGLDVLDTFPLDHKALLERIASPRRVLMLHCALGLVAPVDFEDEDGWTPLHVAALAGHNDAIRFLVLLSQEPEQYSRKVMRTLASLGAELGIDSRELVLARQDIQDAVDEQRRWSS